MNMLDDLLELLYRFPGTARAFGAALYSVGGFAPHTTISSRPSASRWLAGTLRTWKIHLNFMKYV